MDQGAQVSQNTEARLTEAARRGHMASVVFSTGLPRMMQNLLILRLETQFGLVWIQRVVTNSYCPPGRQFRMLRSRLQGGRPTEASTFALEVVHNVGT